MRNLGEKLADEEVGKMIRELRSEEYAKMMMAK